MAYLRALDEETLRAIGEAAGQDIGQKPVDLAVSIGALPWKAGGALPAALAEVAGVPASYLPRRTGAVSVIQQIVPAAPLPPLFDFQEAIQGQLVPWLHSAVTGRGAAALLQLPTGSGKTRTALEALITAWSSWLQEGKGEGILWLAHSEELCEQAAETFERLWTSLGSVPLDIVRFWGRASIRGHELVNTFIVAGFSKIVAMRKADRKLYDHVLKTSAVCVIDEAHRALAPTVQRVLRDFRGNPGKAILGLTATPGRSAAEDHENKRLAKLFDGHLVTADDLGPEPIEELQRRGILAAVVRREISSDTDLSARIDAGSGDLSSRTLERLAKNSKRNRLIVETVCSLVAEDRPTLIFACTVDHARELAALTAIAGLKVGAIDCRMNTSARRSLVEQFRAGGLQALFNFGVLTTGFDAPNIGAIVIGRPTTSIVLYSQMIGRALRGPQVGGTRECVVVDIKDNFRAFGDLDTVYNYFDSYWA